MAISAKLSANSYGNLVRVKTGKVRLSFPKLFEKDEMYKKYSASLLIPKGSDTDEVLEKAIENAKADGKTRLWGGKVPGKLKVTRRDGDEPNDEGDVNEAEAGCWVITARTNNKPSVLDTDGTDLFDAESIYGGCYVQAIFEAFPYIQENGAAKGIGFSLSGIKKLADGERLGGGGGYKASASDFDDVDDDEDDDLLG